MKIKQLQIIVCLALCSLAGIQAQTQIIAHRGFWDKLGSAQNSISSLKNAIDMGAYGSEFDVWITRDSVLVLNHDDYCQGVFIQDATYEEISQLRLANKEPLPTLQAYLAIVGKQKTTRLIAEIKPHDSADDDVKAVGETVRLVGESGLDGQIDYISFSEHVCRELIRLDPRHRVAYLNGDKSPQELKDEGYWGLDYAWEVLKDEHPEWIREARELGLTVNVWTVNRVEQMQYFISQGVDFITTDNPQLLKGLLIR
ncbi:MAG: glycerophosphodiester phosphodiesterase [Tannerellaceae bacterium]|jgi:glycerophosphoryl diester phosphodiesterase|nr:glycerophosphodiester phosphodiesterase [Tannerellaceae bacterium]